MKDVARTEDMENVGSWMKRNSIKKRKNLKELLSYKPQSTILNTTWIKYSKKNVGGII